MSSSVFIYIVLLGVDIVTKQLYINLAVDFHQAREDGVEEKLPETTSGRILE